MVMLNIDHHSRSVIEPGGMIGYLACVVVNFGTFPYSCSFVSIIVSVAVRNVCLVWCLDRYFSNRCLGIMYFSIRVLQ